MSLVKPKALKPGALLGIVAPASAVRADFVANGVAELEQLGYRTKLFPHALDKGPLNYAGGLADRVADLHAAFADPEVDAIVCARGGWGSAELLPHLDMDLIRSNPKALIGYSDITSLHIWLQRKAGLVTFHAPMVASDWVRLDAVDLPSWNAALTQTEPWALGTSNGLRVLRPGIADGVLTGGCISIYAESLGTPYAPVPEKAGVLFLEDVGTHPYQWDRMLVHLRYAGMFSGVKGIVFGDMHKCVEPAEFDLLDEQLLHALRDFEGPIAIGLRSGHVAAENVTLPFGVEVRLDLNDAANPQLHFVEAAVRV